MNPDPAPRQQNTKDSDSGDNNSGSGDIDYLTHLARDSARFAEALRQTDPLARVQSCPDWDADDLLWHLADVQWFWSAVVSRGLTLGAEVEALVHAKRPESRDGLLAHFDRASRDLQQNLGDASPETPAWTWSDEQTVGFILRRQAHEALIHRLDAELTAGERTPMDPDLSTDGVDEVLRIMYAGAPPWGRFTPDPTQTVRIQSSDTVGSWLVTLGQLTGVEDDGTAHDEADLEVAVSDTGEPAAATITGAAADLDCWLWRRPAAGVLQRAGAPLVLDLLDEIMAMNNG